jgi:hypothetical protein
MREADMKCKVAVRLLPTNSRGPLTEPPSHLHFPTSAGRLTRSRKLAAEEAFCYEFVAQMKRLRLTARSYSRDAMKNEGGKLAAENFVGSNDQQ